MDKLLTWANGKKNRSFTISYCKARFFVRLCELVKWDVPNEPRPVYPVDLIGYGESLDEAIEAAFRRQGEPR